MGETYGFNMRHYGGTYINCNLNMVKMDLINWNM